MGCSGSKTTDVIVMEARKAPPAKGRESPPSGKHESEPPQLVVEEEDPNMRRMVSKSSEGVLMASTETPNHKGRIIQRMGTKSGYELVKRMAQYNKGNNFDVLVLGGGPAGFRAAVEAAGRGRRVGLVEPKGTVTGAPTGAHSKCLREAVLVGAKTWEQVKEVTGRALDAAARAASRQMKTYMIEVIRGSARMVDENSLEVTMSEPSLPSRTLQFHTLIIATGSKANRFPPVDYDLPGVYDSDTIWGIDRIPNHLVVQGAGIIGLEYSLIFKKMGAKEVTIVDCGEKVAPMLDSDLSKACRKMLEDAGIHIIFKSKFAKTEALPGSSAEDPGVRITLECGRVLECDVLLSACGRYGVTDSINLSVLEPLGLKIGRGKFVQADANGYTGVGSIYAVGDVAGGGLATIGQAQAVRAIRHCMGSGMMAKEKGAAVNPLGVWTLPEMAWAGITEEKAKADGLEYGTVLVDFDRTVRGCVTQEEGFLKLVYNRTNGKILGVHMVGDNSCDLINFGAEAINEDHSIYDILQFVFPAVTYHELYSVAAAEAKQRIMHHGAKSLTAATAWERVEIALRMTCEAEGRSVKDMLHKAFQYFDSESSGFITPEQLKSALKGLGMHLNDTQIWDMVAEATGDPNDTHIEYQDFLRIFNADDADAVHEPQSPKRMM